MTEPPRPSRTPHSPDPDADLRRYIRRSCQNRATRDLLLAAADAGARMRRTRSGVIVYGPAGGTATTHMTGSDHRAAKNLAADLRRIGVLPAAAA